VIVEATPEFDVGPLSWVQGEIDQVLARALEALAKFAAAPGDHAALKLARALVHQAAGAIQKVRLRPHVRHDPGPASGDHVPGNAFAERVLPPLHLLRRQPDRRLRAQPAGGLVEQDERASVHIHLVRNELHDLPERLAQLQRRGQNPADFSQNGQFLVSPQEGCPVRRRCYVAHVHNLSRPTAGCKQNR